MTANNSLSHQDTVKQIRARLNHYGIKASVRKYTACGTRYVSINTPTHDSSFTGEEWAMIALICKTNNLTCARGMEINLGIFLSKGCDFEYHG